MNILKHLAEYYPPPVIKNYGHEPHMPLVKSILIQGFNDVRYNDTFDCIVVETCNNRLGFLAYFIVKVIPKNKVVIRSTYEYRIHPYEFNSLGDLYAKINDIAEVVHKAFEKALLLHEQNKKQLELF